MSRKNISFHCQDKDGKYFFKASNKISVKIQYRTTLQALPSLSISRCKLLNFTIPHGIIFVKLNTKLENPANYARRSTFIVFQRSYSIVSFVIIFIIVTDLAPPRAERRMSTTVFSTQPNSPTRHPYPTERCIIVFYHRILLILAPLSVKGGTPDPALSTPILRAYSSPST